MGCPAAGAGARLRRKCVHVSPSAVHAESLREEEGARPARKQTPHVPVLGNRSSSGTRRGRATGSYPAEGKDCWPTRRAGQQDRRSGCEVMKRRRRTSRRTRPAHTVSTSRPRRGAARTTTRGPAGRTPPPGICAGTCAAGAQPRSREVFRPDDVRRPAQPSVLQLTLCSLRKAACAHNNRK